MTPEVCPICGADVPSNAKVCPGCGSDETTGWSEDAVSQGLDLPEPQEDFKYDDFVKREFGKPDPKPRGIAWYWWVVAVALLILFAYGLVRK